MKLSQFRFRLPEEQIALYPPHRAFENEDGTVERGRAISQPGAHCKGHNAHSIGVAYIGGLDANGQPCDTRTREQKTAMTKLIFNLCKMYHCGVVGHNRYANKACPCFDAYREYQKLAERARQI